jgi:hypothetical protein
MLPFTPSNFITLEGKPRTCKSFVASLIALRDAKHGIPIKSNMGLFFDKFQNLVTRWDNPIELRRAHDCTIIFDEAQLKADNRSFDDLPKQWYDTLPQYGHRKIKYIFTTQDLARCDIKIRTLAEQGDIIYCNTIRLLRIPYDIKKPAIFQISTISRFPFIYFISKFWNKKIYDTFEDTNLEITTCSAVFKNRKLKAVITDGM